MSLNTSKVKYYLPKVLWGIVGVVAAAFLIRVAIWEHNYYTEKEGSERAVAESTVNPGVDETEPSDDDLANYTVPAANPKFLSIEKLGITNSRIKEVSVDSTTGELGTPSNIFDTGWWNQSGKPGQGGTMLLDGHNGGPTKEGVFKHLNYLVAGDLITVTRGDDQIFTYKVVDSVTVDLDDAQAWMEKAQLSPETGVESLSIITCTGNWISAESTYDQRHFIRAVLVE